MEAGVAYKPTTQAWYMPQIKATYHNYTYYNYNRLTSPRRLDAR
jgi:hypothetical protein